MAEWFNHLFEAKPEKLRAFGLAVLVWTVVLATTCAKHSGMFAWTLQMPAAMQLMFWPIFLFGLYAFISGVSSWVTDWRGAARDKAFEAEEQASQKRYYLYQGARWYLWTEGRGDKPVCDKCLIDMVYEPHRLICPECNLGIEGFWKDIVSEMRARAEQARRRGDMANFRSE